MNLLKWFFKEKKSSEQSHSLTPLFNSMRWNPKIVHAEYRDGILTAKLDFGDYKETRKFKGSSTVWHAYPMMKRCKTSAEQELSDIYTYICEHGNPYPTAHEKKAG